MTDRPTPSVTYRLLIMYGILLPHLFLRCIGVVNRNHRRSTSCFSLITVERIVAECTVYYTLVTEKMCGLNKNNWLPWQRPLSHRNPISHQSPMPIGLPVVKQRSVRPTNLQSQQAYLQTALMYSNICVLVALAVHISTTYVHSNAAFCQINLTPCLLLDALPDAQSAVSKY